MKNIIIKSIDLYQKLPISWHAHCRFYPTCSEYMKQAIIIHGAQRGIIFGLKRLSKCHPFGKSGIDLVPPKKEV